jgi:putative phosphoribosyl transferase
MKTQQFEITIPVDHIELKGILTLPSKANSLVIFSHGSGSSRLSPRNKFVADFLNNNGIATLLTDLLTEKEDDYYATRFDIDLLTHRLISVTDFVRNHPEYGTFTLGYFGASTGAASALCAAAHLGEAISAVVSRGGRPDLAKHDLPAVTSPTLLIVGGLDEDVIELNEMALDLLECAKKLVIVGGATHLFEETGKLQEVAKLAAEWFEKHLARKGQIILSH